MISVRDLSLFPDVHRLRALLRSMAMLDAILSPEWQFRYYSFNAHWSDGEEMGSMRNGSGDEFFALFSGVGCFLKGFAHEAAMTPYAHDPPQVWPGVIDEVPAEFAEFLSEPAFDAKSTTFCIWRRHGDPAWQHDSIRFPFDADPDGSETLLSPLNGLPRTYQVWAEHYYERSVSLPAVQDVYEHRPLTNEFVKSLNTELSLLHLADDVREIGYPREGDV